MPMLQIGGRQPGSPAQRQNGFNSRSSSHTEMGWRSIRRCHLMPEKVPNVSAPPSKDVGNARRQHALHVTLWCWLDNNTASSA